MKARGYNSSHSWFIATACGFISLMSQAPTVLAGLLFLALLDRYGSDRALASWPFTIFRVMKCAPGPLIAYLGEYMGLRYLTVLGALLASIGVGLCFFAESMTAVIIFLGLISGTGMSFANTLMPQILKQHFDKSIARANGVCLAMSCLGAVAFSPIVKFLLNSYGLSGTFLILFAVMLNGIPVAYLLKNPKYKKRPFSGKAIPVIDPESGNEFVQGSKQKAGETGDGTRTVETCNGMTEIIKQDRERTGSVRTEIVQKDTSETNTEKQERTEPVAEKVFLSPSATAKRENAETSKTESVRRQPCNSRRDRIELVLTESEKTETFMVKNSGKEINEIVTVLKTENQLDQGDIKSKQIPNESLDEVMSIVGTEERETEVTPLVNFDSTAATRKESKFRDALQTLNVFKDPIFLVILVTHGVLSFSVSCIYPILVDASRDKGIPGHQGIYFVMALPAAELTGFLGLGWVTDNGFLSKVNYIALCLFLFSVGCGDIVWSTGFFTMLIGVFLIGICSAGIGSTFPSLIYEYIDEDKHSMAISSRRMLFTPLSFTVAPLLGYFRDNLGSYDGLLYFNGAINLACCFLTLLIPCLLWRRKSKERKMCSQVKSSNVHH